MARLPRMIQTVWNRDSVRSTDAYSQQTYAAGETHRKTTDFYFGPTERFDYVGVSDRHAPRTPEATRRIPLRPVAHVAYD